MSGYSGTPLARKLGLADGTAAAFVALPETLAGLTRAAAFRSLETVAEPAALQGRGLDYLHLFTARAADLDALPGLRARLAPAGMLWVSWPKQAAGVPTDLTETVIRDRALADVLVDVKVCAVDAVWSGLKLVIRKAHRPT